MLNQVALIPNLSNTEYHATTGISSSGIIKILQGTPAHYKSYLEEKREPTKAMNLGTAIHMAVLEPHAFSSTYVCKPEGMSFATVEGKAWKAAQKDKQILEFEEWKSVNGVLNTLEQRPDIRKFFSGGTAEQSFFWTDAETGLVCKCRPDYFDGKIAVDIKTAESAHERAFISSVAKYYFHIQSAFYLEGLSQYAGKQLNDFVHVVIEKPAPNGIACYALDDASLERARLDIRRALRTIKECQEKNEWPGYPTGISTTGLPHYMWGEDNE